MPSPTLVLAENVPLMQGLRKCRSASRTSRIGRGCEPTCKRRATLSANRQYSIKPGSENEAADGEMQRLEEEGQTVSFALLWPAINPGPQRCTEGPIEPAGLGEYRVFGTWNWRSPCLYDVSGPIFGPCVRTRHSGLDSAMHRSTRRLSRRP